MYCGPDLRALQPTRPGSVQETSRMIRSLLAKAYASIKPLALIAPIVLITSAVIAVPDASAQQPGKDACARCLVSS